MVTNTRLRERVRSAAELGAAGLHAQAEAELWEVVRVEPGFAGARCNLGVALEHQERYEEAAEQLREAVRLEPGYLAAWVNLSNTLRKGWRAEEAVAAAERAVRLPGGPSAEALNALGSAMLELGRADEALDAFGRAVATGPGHAEARVNRAMTLLVRGDWRAGFREFECRFDHPVWRRPMRGRRWQVSAEPHASPGWASAGLAPGTRVLLYGEGGLGNAIQFCRYASRVADLDAEVAVECRAELVPLMRQVRGVSRVVPFGERAFPRPSRGDLDDPGYDCYAALMSLPALLGLDQATVARDVPYLKAEPSRVEHWGRVLATMRQSSGDSTDRLVGVCWQGEQVPAFRRNRSIGPEPFARLASVPGVRLVSLQKGLTTAAVPGLIEPPDLDATGGAFLETAAIMHHLDLVITCDTSIAHLAGALGKPTWVALPFAADWRWMRDREDTAWYPTMRLFRQTVAGRWSDVFERIAQALETA